MASRERISHHVCCHLWYFGISRLVISVGETDAGGWRVAALLPLLVVIPVVVVTIRDLQQGSNLWPLLLIFLAPVLLLYHKALLFLHTRTHNR